MQQGGTHEVGGFLIAEPSNVTRGNERKRLFAQMTGSLRLIQISVKTFRYMLSVKFAFHDNIAYDMRKKRYRP